MGIGLYGRAGLDIYEKAHYSRDEHIEEVRQILEWLPPGPGRVLDIGCSAGLHALELAGQGYTAVGVDLERFAIERGTRDGLSALGRFEFIYSLGNVLSHIGKAEVPGVLKRILSCLEGKGIFLFDLLIKGSPFRTNIRDDYHRIFWERRLDERTGRIEMDGHFLDFGILQHFDVWGYSVDEALGLLEAAGFSPDGVSDRLDFTSPAIEESNPFCLNFRARPKEESSR
jgi:SAM-dependent methyltransferase